MSTMMLVCDDFGRYIRVTRRQTHHFVSSYMFCITLITHSQPPLFSSVVSGFFSFSISFSFSFSSMAYTVDPRHVDPLVVAHVIGDVVDMFIPSAKMIVAYGPKNITNGCIFKPSLATERPNIYITGHSDDIYTLVMTDPDAPSPSEPSMRELVHWILVDIPGSSSICRGKEILPYMSPMPPLGIHRYVFVLFRQKNLLYGTVDPPPSRAQFSTRAFADYHNLGLPVATVYFNAQKEPRGRRR